MSLGCESAPTALAMICNYAWTKKNILIVSGAGNQDDGDPVPPWESNVEYPARYYRDVIGVSSIDASNKIASNSARGPEVKLCAPGVHIRSTVLNGKCGFGSGTSVASPHVAGVAALAWKAHEASGIDNEGVWNLLAHTADNLGRPGRDSLYGYGRVNALAAVTATLPVPIMPKGACCQ
jgi:subtilisin